MNFRDRNPVLMLLVLAFVLMFTSCSPKFNEYITVLDDKSNINAGNPTGESVTLKYTVQTATESKKLPRSSPVENEINSLRMVLAPYMNPIDPKYIGDENKEIIEMLLLNTKESRDPMPIKDWEQVIRILLHFGAKDDKLIKMYITDFYKQGFIERQHAVSGFMKLLSLRYPISLGGDPESFRRSEIITDLDTVDDKYQGLIRQAYCLGLTDFSVEAEKLFRPYHLLARTEAVSMFYHVFLNYGLPPDATPEEAPSGQSEDTPEASDENQALTAFFKEDIQQEYRDYLKSLEKKGEKGIKKIVVLRQAEGIIDPGEYWEYSGNTVALTDWEKIFCDVFGLDQELVRSYLYQDTGDVLTYDVAAISIFKLSHLFGGYDARDASEKEIKKAHDAIPQFDTARDTSKFAQMFTSGLLEGLYQIPGFTPQRPVSKAEAILLVKRIVENLP